MAPGSKIMTVEEANAAAVCALAARQIQQPSRAAQKASSQATYVPFPGVDAAIKAMQAGEIDAIALSRKSLTGVALKIPGSRVLNGGFLSNTTPAVAVPKGKPDALGLC